MYHPGVPNFFRFEVVKIPRGVLTRGGAGKEFCERTNAFLRLLTTSFPACVDVRRDFTSFALEVVIPSGIARGLH